MSQGRSGTGGFPREKCNVPAGRETPGEEKTTVSVTISIKHALKKYGDNVIIPDLNAEIKQGDEVVHVGIMAAAKRVDTTGAGDFYAAGFLSGLCDGLSLRQCGTIGAITAGKVIEVVGTTFGEEAWEDISRLVNKVKNEKYLF